MDFDELATVNKEVVRLTSEPHEFSRADGEKLERLLSEVKERANNEEFDEAINEKAALLVFRIASGQHFRGGNKRTALIAGLVFLLKNGRKLDIENPGLVSSVDKVGIAAASLDDLYEAMRRLVTKSPTERRSWETAIKKAVEANKKFLVEAGS
jgi:prophage maintenance system killer protein